MTVQELLPYLLFFNTAAAIGSVLYAWFSSSGKEALSGLEKLKKETEERLKKLESDTSIADTDLAVRCGAMEQSVAVLQSTVDHLPSTATTQRLELAVARIEGSIETLTERLKPVSAIALRLQEQAMEGARR